MNKINSSDRDTTMKKTTFLLCVLVCTASSISVYDSPKERQRIDSYLQPAPYYGSYGYGLQPQPYFSQCPPVIGVPIIPPKELKKKLKPLKEHFMNEFLPGYKHIFK